MVLILHIYHHIALEKLCQFRAFLSFFCLAKIRQTKRELRYDCYFRNNKWFTNSSVFTKKCQMLQCDTVMKVTNEKKGIFSFYLHNLNKKL